MQLYLHYFIGLSMKGNLKFVLGNIQEKATKNIQKLIGICKATNLIKFKVKPYKEN